MPAVMNPRFLKTFLRVTHHRSFTQAARELHLAQSSVSDQIQALEDELGTALFIRSKAGLQPTLAGNTFTAHAQGILAAIESARQAVAAADRTSGQPVVIGALETVAAEILPSTLASFRRAHPELGIRIDVAGSADLLQWLHDGRIEVAFYFRRGELDGRLARRAVASEPLVLIGPPKTDAAEESLDLETPSAMPFIATEPGCVYRHIFDDAWRQAGKAPPKPILEASSVGAIVRLVAAGTGFALVPRLAAARFLESSTIRAHPWPARNVTATLDMVWRRRRTQARGVSLLLAWMERLQRPIKRGDARLPHEGPYQL